MRRLIDWTRSRIAYWLRLNHDRTRADELTATLATLADQNAKMAAALHQIVAQLNSNTVTMQRWAHESATLQDIERRHARREAIGGNGNGSGLVVVR